MKFRLLTLALLCCGAAATAQNPYIALEGAAESAAGIAVSMPRSVLAVDLSVECSTVLCGPYARYAQKYLGVRAPLTDKTTWSIAGARIALAGDDAFGAAAPAADASRVVSHAASDEAFAALQPDKTSATVYSLEDAARMAAELDIGRAGSSPGFDLRFGEEALRQMEEYAWPGNVRELRNAVERGVLHAGTDENGVFVVERLELNPFAPGVLPPAAAPGADAAREDGPEKTPERGMLPPGFSLREELARQEREVLQRALRQARYRQTEAARLLGLTYHQFRALYRKHGERKRGQESS